MKQSIKARLVEFRSPSFRCVQWEADIQTHGILNRKSGQPTYSIGSVSSALYENPNIKRDNPPYPADLNIYTPPAIF